MMEDINKSEGKARAESSRIAAEYIKKQFEGVKKKVRQAVTKTELDRAELDVVIDETNTVLDECKVVHAEFKPRIR